MPKVRQILMICVQSTGLEIAANSLTDPDSACGAGRTGGEGSCCFSGIELQNLLGIMRSLWMTWKPQKSMLKVVRCAKA
jgi:hypothetical protein